MGKIYNRTTNEFYDDVQYAGGGLDFLYNTIPGRLILKVVICPFLSKLYGCYMKTSLSRIHIKSFVLKNHIDMSRFEDKDYCSFNEFFIRKPLRLNVDMDVNRFVSPADSKLFVYPIDEELTIPVKKGLYTVNELLGGNIDTETLNYYKGGTCMVFRLAVDDYHRYHYVDDGRLLKTESIKGCLHTISSYSDKYNVFAKNSRVVNYLSTDNFGDIVVIEVGAMFVGKIVNNQLESFKKGQEKGWFEPGGSTIVILTSDKVKIDSDIIENSSKGIETKLYCGESIGTALL